MRIKNRFHSGIWRAAGMLAVMAFGFVSIVATGGGGGSSSVTGSFNSGTVGVSITDGPADEYDEIWIQLREVSLIPENDGDPVVVWQAGDPDGHWINLLKYRDEEEGEFLLTINRNVPEGVYSKLRLKVGGIESVGGACDLQTIHLPSGKIDLNPREPFTVRSGVPIWVSFDIDADKSVDLHPAGKSGKCIFRPMVFVEVRPGDFSSDCPLILQGAVGRIADSGEPGFFVTAFTLIPDSGGESVTVRMQRGTVVFDIDGLPLEGNATTDDLQSGDRIWVRGVLDENGELLPSEIIVGKVQAVNGIVQSDGVSADGVFSLYLDPTESIDVQVYEDSTLILLDCETEGTLDNIFRGLQTRVIGKYSESDDQLRAAAILIKPVSGELVSIDPVAVGRDLRILQKSGTEIVIFLPDDAPVKLRGDGRVPDELLCPGRKVVVIQDAASPRSASKLIVESDVLKGEITAIDTEEHTLTVQPDVGDPVLVQIDPFDETYTTILANEGGETKGIEFEDLRVGDYVEIYGLEACAFDDAAFYGFIIIASVALDDNDYDELPYTVRENNVSRYLVAGKYEQNLDVRGNNFRLTGEAGPEGRLSDDGWTVIGGRVVINGNNAVFTNIWFDGPVEINGNNTKFYNCWSPWRSLP